MYMKVKICLYLYTNACIASRAAKSKNKNDCTHDKSSIKPYFTSERCIPLIRVRGVLSCT